MSMARSERRQRDQRKEQGAIWIGIGLLAMAVTQIPRLPIPLYMGLSIAWILTWKAARYGYKYHLSIKSTLLVMLLHGLVLAAVGYFMWPRMTVSPSRASF